MPSSSVTLAGLEAHIDRLSAAAPTYKSRFSSFQGPSKSKDHTIDVFHVSETERAAARANAASHTNQYYDIVTRAYERGWDEHFHFAPFAPNDSISHALQFVVYRLAILLNIKPHHKVLDVGCGIGGAARELAKLVGCEVIGITINQYQVDRAIELTAREGLGHLCTFIRADFMDLPFPDNYFDTVLAIEACCHAPSLAHAYAQCWRVLKPHRQFGFTEQLMTDPASGPAYKYDESLEKHRDIRNRMEVGGGMACIQPASTARASLKRAGFTIELDEDYARYFERLSGPVPFVFADEEGQHSPATQPKPTEYHHYHYNRPIKSFFPIQIPNRSGNGTYLAPPPSKTYHAITSTKSHPIPPPFRPVSYPITGTPTALSMTVTSEDRKIVAAMSHSRRKWTYLLARVLVWFGLIPPETVTVNKMLALYLDAIVEGVAMDIFSPCWMFVCRKGEGVCEEGLLEPLVVGAEGEGELGVSKGVAVAGPAGGVDALPRKPSKLSEDNDEHDGYRTPPADLVDMVGIDIPIKP
ncbi:Delta(24)-sterol C-methyltransferase [Knufia obscura]|uniref:Sterol 24-C-methyltransferase n=1 Tax=Knufia obscura TaxID=1635080 RepID=A0ABR0RW35_9EURO|nr:Delta(24)-sterol C-methyltransferase [Knufia obscura]